MRIGITGQIGFVGYHLYNTIKYCHPDCQLIEFKDEYFDDESVLKNFLSQCDVVVHLAALNRHNDEKAIFDVNVGLVKKIVKILNENNFKPHILFSSSIQEFTNTVYGQSKKEGRLILENWAKENNALFTGLIMPNIFGAFGIPFYNSVISTFSHQLCHDKQPKIDIDADLNLLYVNDLVEEIIKLIIQPVNKFEVKIEPNCNYKVSELFKLLTDFKECYFNNKIIPELNNSFSISLFNTFRTYLDYDFFPVYPKVNVDERGYLSEVLKTNTKGQVFFSVTKPGIVRGNHFHRRKIERFIVIKGNAVIRLRKIGTNEIIEYNINADEKPGFVDMPIYHTHNIENIGNTEMTTLFWTNEFYSPDDPDTYFEKV